MRAIEGVSDELQHSPEEKTTAEEENKKSSRKVVWFNQFQPYIQYMYYIVLFES